ncbi:MAG: hypothetical protein EHM46_03885, partial [Bacteroidetes bacterium]
MLESVKLLLLFLWLSSCRGAATILFFAVVLSTPGALFGQLSANEIDELVNEALERFHTAGAAVAVVRDGKVVHSKGYGVRSAATGEPVD